MIPPTLLFSVSEFTPAAFVRSGRVSLHYVLTLILNREGDDILYIAAPVRNYRSSVGS